MTIPPTNVVASQPQRTRFATKAEWAEAKARDLRDQAHALRYQSSEGVSWKAARKFEAVTRMEQEACRFDSMARTFRRKGL